jgi:hypothetical protein
MTLVFPFVNRSYYMPNIGKTIHSDKAFTGDAVLF